MIMHGEADRCEVADIKPEGAFRESSALGRVETNGDDLRLLLCVRL